MLSRHLGKEGNIACNLSPQDMAKVVAKTQGYSGSDMRALVQEACQVQSCFCADEMSHSQDIAQQGQGAAHAAMQQGGQPEWEVTL